MRALETVRRLLGKLAVIAASRRSEPEFTCSDCIAWKRCDRPSGDHCALKEILIARGYRRRTEHIGLPYGAQ